MRGDSSGVSHVELDKLSSDVSESINEPLEVAGVVDILQSQKPETRKGVLLSLQPSGTSRKKYCDNGERCVT